MTPTLMPGCNQCTLLAKVSLSVLHAGAYKSQGLGLCRRIIEGTALMPGCNQYTLLTEVSLSVLYAGAYKSQGLGFMSAHY